jgi:hypothetical protein
MLSVGDVPPLNVTGAVSADKALPEAVPEDDHIASEATVLVEFPLCDLVLQLAAQEASLDPSKSEAETFEYSAAEKSTL